MLSALAFAFFLSFPVVELSDSTKVFAWLDCLVLCYIIVFQDRDAPGRTSVSVNPPASWFGCKCSFEVILENAQGFNTPKSYINVASEQHARMNILMVRPQHLGERGAWFRFQGTPSSSNTLFVPPDEQIVRLTPENLERLQGALKRNLTYRELADVR